MAKHYVSKKFNPILFNLERCNLTKNDLCNRLNVSRLTLNSYIERPDKLSLHQLYIIAGSFGIAPESFLYMLLRNKPTLKEADKWYIQEQVNKADKMV